MYIIVAPDRNFFFLEVFWKSAVLCLIEGLSDVQADWLYCVPIKKKLVNFAKMSSLYLPYPVLRNMQCLLQGNYESNLKAVRRHNSYAAQRLIASYETALCWSRCVRVFMSWQLFSPHQKEKIKTKFLWVDFLMEKTFLNGNSLAWKLP